MGKRARVTKKKREKATNETFWKITEGFLSDYCLSKRRNNYNCAYRTPQFFTRLSLNNSRSRFEMLLKTSQLQYDNNIIPLSCFSLPSLLHLTVFFIKPSNRKRFGSQHVVSSFANPPPSHSFPPKLLFLCIFQTRRPLSKEEFCAYCVFLFSACHWSDSLAFREQESAETNVRTRLLNASFFCFPAQ